MKISSIGSLTVDGRTLRLRPFEGPADGRFIRELTEENFRVSLEKTIGWDAAKHEVQPEFPERYTMVTDGENTIGFLSVRDQPDAFYLETIQLLQSYRNKGIGTKLMHYVERVAYSEGKQWLRFRVFKNNPAKHLYERLDYEIAEDQDWCFLMEKKTVPNK